MKFLALSALALVAVVNAQATPPTPDTCILTCAEQACPSEFTSANTTDYSCFCSTGTAQIIACLTANCTAADLQTAQGLEVSVCGGSNSTAPAPAPASNGTTTAPGTTVTSSTKGAATGSATGSSTSKASAAASSSSASNSNIAVGNSGLAGVLALAVALAVAVGVVA